MSDFNPTEINRIVEATTTVYRNRPVVTTTPHGAINIDGYPHVDDADPGEEIVDMVFVHVGVKKAVAAARRSDLIAAIGDGHLPESGHDMASGPSYVHLGGDLGSQEYALRFMALGHVVGLWEIVAPHRMGFSDRADQEKMAGLGLIYAIGYRQPASV